ncbi:hypothetical protein PR202_ga07270 [Eleusine coracana subsp. coracana]|uniref:F-box protein AT5G49610-like beta-propeller domain-containing protein n=1 Tax=Eleusine coracana subsp. coracana TaxID=191504 RepID=A0AAV5BX63_ELECO|nr:hypothetical protein QOZ80_2AG0110170 [Eleusine coracana subsp. coracana]GJM90943.1 hypothetical protein PR202_ga07270 [Eleusine coracana subsp. coracana]
MGPVSSGPHQDLFPDSIFVPMPQSPAESAAVIRRGSFQFHLEHGIFHNGVWDCRNGRLIIDSYMQAGQDVVTLFSPLHPARSTSIITAFQNLEIPEQSGYGCWFYNEFILFPDDGGDDISAVTFIINRQAARAHLSELQAGAWSQVRISDTIELPQRSRRILPPLHAHGKFYMVCMAGHILALDPGLMSLFCIKLPDGMEYEDRENFALCRAEGAGFFLIHLNMSRIYVWAHSTGCRIGSWKLLDSLCVHQVFGYLVDPSFRLSKNSVVRVTVAGDNANFVILEIEQKLFCVHIWSRTVEKVFELPTCRKGFEVHPFMMVWPSTFPKWSDGQDTI